MIHGSKNLCSAILIFRLQTISRCMTSTRHNTRVQRNELFGREKNRQLAAVGRIEKIKVSYEGFEDKIKLLMNKELSTPFDCAKHISEGLAMFSALASVNGVSWDMHKPLISDCQLRLHTMQMSNDKAINSAFWRTCSLMLGAVVDSAFMDTIPCHLHSFTVPSIKSGSFIYDVCLDLPDWNPTLSEMQVLSSLFTKLIKKDIPIERLEVHQQLALEMFQENPYKMKQIPDIARNNDDKIVLYRVGKHVDISKGPMIGSTGIVGRSTLSAIHKYKNDTGDLLHRFQGIALPKGILVNHFTYRILENRGKKLNQTMWMPHRMEPETEQIKAAAANN